MTKAPPMLNDIDAIVDDLLARWHRYTAGYQQTKGYGSSSATTRDYNGPTHWDWQNGAEDARAEKLVMKAVGEAIYRVPDAPCHWRTCIVIEARNLASVAAVWRSPRLPQDQAELEVLRIEARNKLLKELQRDGVIG